MVYCVFLIGALNFFLKIKFLSLRGGILDVNLVFDYITFGVLLMLLICFLYVWFYTGHYFSNDIGGVNLKKIICLFVVVMASLVCTGDYITTLIFWEYLGVVRFFLILFYDRYLSLRSSIITLVSSRFGDVCLFLLITLRCYLFSSSMLFGLLLILFIILTKSARFPFISWLLEAMRAPTPVSSLVHSSTLVAAGVWFSMRYDFLMFFEKSLIFRILLLITIFVTGVCCFYFIDLKKIVALSTCNKIAWCIFYLIFGDVCLSLFQLIRHGVSKCMLFMLVGDVMRGSGGSQSSNCVYSALLYNNWGIFSLISVILGLSGAPFIGVFFTKHYLLTYFIGISNVFLFLFTMLCVFLSYFYSFRFCAILLKLKARLTTGVLFFFKSGVMLYFWLLINFFICYTLKETCSLGFYRSLWLLIFQFMSCLTAYYFYNRSLISNWSSSLFGCDKLVELFYGLFFNLLHIVRLFFYRWDNQVISLFNRFGWFTLEVYKKKMLNIIVFRVIFLLMWWYIIY